VNEQERLRAIPSVDSALEALKSAGMAEAVGHQMLVRSVRSTLEDARRLVRGGHYDGIATSGELREAVLDLVRDGVRRSGLLGLRRVVNATGVIVHTNLGRAPLAREALEAVVAAGGYCNVEYDLAEGRRGRRGSRVVQMLCALTGAEDAIVVNNNAAAVMLALNTLAAGREVVVGRGELIEIGGSFRLPEVFAKSAARLVEVGTTNRTRIGDFEEAVRSQTAAVMMAHWSNYAIVGFVETVSIPDLVRLGERVGVPVIHDLGSGAMLDTAALGLAHEPTVAESVSAGASVSTFSGDKLLGGPQAGIAVGRAETIAAMRSNPLARALRPGKMTLAALEATLDLYLLDRAAARVPVLAAAATPLTALRERAAAMVGALAGRCGEGARVEAVDLSARIGGGALPQGEIASAGVEIEPSDVSAASVAEALLLREPPIVVRVHEDRIVLDLRTVDSTDDDLLASSLTEVFLTHER